MTFSEMHIINNALYEAIGPDSMFPYPMPPDSIAFGQNKALIVAIVNNDHEALGQLIMSVARPYFLAQILDDDSHHDHDLVEFLRENGIDISDGGDNE